jgi:ribonuclease T2
MRIPLLLSVSAWLLFSPGCRTSHEVPPLPPSKTSTLPRPASAPTQTATVATTARPYAQATPEAVESEFGRPSATACTCATAGAGGVGGPNAAPSFGLYLLALSWAPNFCLGHPDKEECQNLAGTFASNHLTLHGLWPQYNDAQAQQRGCTYPAFCGQACACQRSGAPEQCFPNPSDLPVNISTYGPGYVGDNYFLANHEWPKHGSCTGLDARTYFAEAVQALLALPGDQGTPAALANNVGGRVAVSELRSAFGASNSVVLGCDNSCNLTDVGVCLGADGLGHVTTPVPCPNNVTGSPSNSCVGTGPQPRCANVSIQQASTGGGGGGGGGPGGGACNHPGQGPACTEDGACRQQGYARCAKSGCCTTVPKR